MKTILRRCTKGNKAWTRCYSWSGLTSIHLIDTDYILRINSMSWIMNKNISDLFNS